MPGAELTQENKRAQHRGMDNRPKRITPAPVATGADAEPRAAARQLLERALESGPRPAAEILHAAEDAGIAPGALRRAREELGVRAEKKGFGASGEWLLSLGALGAATGPEGGSPLGWGLLAAGAVAFGLAYLCIEANRAAAGRGGCPAPAVGGFPAPPGGRPKSCCPNWFIVLLIFAAVALAILGLARL